MTTMVLVGGCFSGGTTLTVDLIARAFDQDLGATLAYSEYPSTALLCRRWIAEPTPILRGLATQLFQEVKEAIESALADRVWLLKHPNLLSLAPLVAQVLAPHGHRVVTVGTRRSVDDIVHSLIRRGWYGPDERPLRTAARLLVARALEADVVFDYDRCLTDPIPTTEALLHAVARVTSWSLVRGAEDVAGMIRRPRVLDHGTSRSASSRLARPRTR
ncbi:MAG: hypothetical protein AB1Z98_17790 [Nannocystaceae bacterium]